MSNDAVQLGSESDKLTTEPESDESERTSQIEIENGINNSTTESDSNELTVATAGSEIKLTVPRLSESLAPLLAPSASFTSEEMAQNVRNSPIRTKTRRSKSIDSTNFLHKTRHPRYADLTQHGSGRFHSNRSESPSRVLSLSQEMDLFVLNIEAQLDSSVIFDPTKPLQTYINNKERPSIFIDRSKFDRFRQVYFFHDKTAWQYVAFMRNWFGLDVRSYFKDIQEKEDVALGYYQGLGWDQDHRAKQRKDFFEYLLINSCILVFAILSYRNEWNTIGIISATKEKMTDQKSMECYHLYQQFMAYSQLNKQLMLTMDNQIPWFVVEDVYTRHSTLSKLVGTPIEKLAFSCFDDLYPRVHKTKMHSGTGTLPPGGFKHLLHIFHWTRTPEGKYLVDTKSLVDVKKMDSFYISSATELRLSANVFDLHTGGSMDVSYYERGLSGVMKLAPWLHFPYSIDICKDLLKFEQGYENCGFPVTAYVACMVCLLRREADVILLRETGIIPSTRSDEKDILLSVEELKLLLRHDVRMSNDLTILWANVKAHHERSSCKYYGEFKKSYCSSPWITISVIAGILLFVLTFIQTMYTALSYYKQ